MPGARSAPIETPAAQLDLHRSPLHAEHLDLGAKLVPFGGWEMPLAYPPGTVAEHRACRSGAVVFDVSHLGTLAVRGPGAFDRLQECLSNDLRRISAGRAQYTHLLNPAGGVDDDIIVWWVDAETFDVMPNASNTARVEAALGGLDITADRVVLAIQGPSARERLARVSPEAAATPRFSVRRVGWRGVAVLVAGTGYTGEDGVECAVPAEHAAGFFRAVLEAGVDPAGLGARDTLRLEAGLPLHGHELGPEITPLEAGLGWVVGWDKEHFTGQEVLEEQRRQGPGRILRGLVASGRRPLRDGAPVYRGVATSTTGEAGTTGTTGEAGTTSTTGEAGTTGEVAVGVVTSGNFSPMLERGVGLAFVSTDPERAVGDGDQVVVRQRSTELDAQVVRPPLWPPRRETDRGGAA